MLYVLKTRKTYDGFSQWAISSVIYIFALALLGLRNFIPDFFSVIVANTLIVTGNIFIAYGLERFTNSVNRIWLFVLLATVMIISFSFYTYFHPDTNARISIISSVIAVLYTYCAHVIHKQVPRLINTHNNFLVVTFSIQAIWLVLRIIQTVFVDDPVIDFMNAPAFHAITVIVFFCGNILITAGLIVLNFQRVEYDLSTVLAEVKTLRGLLPICASCKRIRDDHGLWNQIELYIENHSDAEFSHGICPECVQRLYPGYGISDD
tara:strand:- start:813 stop:1604 length:792 start_codon:yes stop_codon:yes gene_type:complete